jgi:hypothetical protein
MRFGIIKYENGEIVSLSNLDKKLPKEKRQYIILEETEDASELDRLLAKHTGKQIKPKVKREPPVCSIEYCELHNWTFVGMKKGNMKYLRLLSPFEQISNSEDIVGIVTKSHQEYTEWFKNN